MSDAGGADVLLAEDDRELRRLIAGALARDGYAVLEADSGRALLDRLWERARSGRPFALIVSDVCMPGASGLDVLEGLREQCEPSIGDTPVILITAFGDERVHAEAARLGAQIVDKPFDLDELRAQARRLAPLPPPATAAGDGGHRLLVARAPGPAPRSPSDTRRW